MLNGAENIEGITPEILEQVNKLADGLLNKNQELLSKVSAKQENSAASEAELKALRDFKTQSEIQAAKDSEKWQEALELKEKSFNTQIEEYTQKNSALEQQVTKLLIDDGLSKALDGVNINPSLKRGAESMLRASATISDGKAMIGEKSLSDAVKEWSETDAGKPYCLASNNTGGNANGGTNEKPSGKDADFKARLKAAGLT